MRQDEQSMNDPRNTAYGSRQPAQNIPQGMGSGVGMGSIGGSLGAGVGSGFGGGFGSPAGSLPSWTQGSNIQGEAPPTQGMHQHFGSQQSGYGGSQYGIQGQGNTGYADYGPSGPQSVNLPSWTQGLSRGYGGEGWAGGQVSGQNLPSWTSGSSMGYSGGPQWGSWGSMSPSQVNLPPWTQGVSSGFGQQPSHFTGLPSWTQGSGQFGSYPNQPYGSSGLGQGFAGQGLSGHGGFSQGYNQGYGGQQGFGVQQGYGSQMNRQMGGQGPMGQPETSGQS